MKAKKDKSLEMELMDDLMEDNPSSPGVLESSGDNQNKVRAQAKTSVEESSDAELVLDIPEVEHHTEALPNFGKSTVFDQADDRTMKLPEADDSQPDVELESSVPPGVADRTQVAGHRKGKVEPQTKVGKFAVRSSGGVLSGAEAALTQSENLRIAQQRILDLEKEIERLRSENESLAAAGETLRKRSDELLAKAQNIESKFAHTRELHHEEKEALLGSLASKDQQSQELKRKIEELEMRLSTNIQKIRVRERELENRLELIKMESSAIVRSKDELILDLKRQLDQLNLELDNYRQKGQELNRVLGDKQDLMRRTVKTLRLALSLLEGADESDTPSKKAKTG